MIWRKICFLVLSMSVSILGSGGLAQNGSAHRHSDLALWADDYRAGNQDALVRLFMSCHDLDLPVCDELAIRANLENAADNGHAGPQSLLGSLRLSEAQTPQDRDVAIALLNRAIGQGHPAAMIAVADFLVDDASDPARARALYMQAFAQGASLAAYRLGLLDQLGIGVSQPDLQSAQRYLQAAADMGNPLALTALGAFALAAVDDPDRLQKAEQFFRQAHDQGLGEATLGLVDVLLAGPDPELNYFEISFLLENAAAQGNVEAQFRLGVLLQEGTGMPRDQKQARYWLETAARQGHDLAALALAASYRPFLDSGISSYPARDIDAALYWLDQAMAAEIPEAFYLAGRIHFDGDGGRPRDRAQAERLLGHALQLGLDPQFEARAEFVFRQAESLRLANQRIQGQQALQIFVIGMLLYGAFNGSGSGQGSMYQCAHVRCDPPGLFTSGNAGVDMWGYSLMMR